MQLKPWEDSMGRLVRKDVTIPDGRLLKFDMGAVRAPRNIVAPDLAAANAGPADQTDTDNYATRIVKYIPAEVVAFYLAADKLFVKAPAATGANVAEKFVAEHAYDFSIGIFVLALIGTPIYLWQMSRQDDPVIINLAVSTLAFPIWAYAVQGEVFAPVYSSAIASFLVLFFTFVSGFIKPGK
jgi:hypothetical protein